jgi:hypothetical protein
MADYPPYHVIVGKNAWSRNYFVEVVFLDIFEIIDIFFIFILKISFFKEVVNFAMDSMQFMIPI